MSAQQSYYAEQFHVRSETRNKCNRCRNKFPNAQDSCPKCGSTDVAPLEHTVSLRHDGGWECGCESWIFGRKRHSSGWGCKHIEEVRASYDAAAVAANRRAGQRTVIRTAESTIELAEDPDGRIKGFLDKLDK
jgi:hypothetical protein